MNAKQFLVHEIKCGLWFIIGNHSLFLRDEYANQTFCEHAFHIDPGMGRVEEFCTVFSCASEKVPFATGMEWEIGRDIVYAAIEGCPDVLGRFRMLGKEGRRHFDEIRVGQTLKTSLLVDSSRISVKSSGLEDVPSNRYQSAVTWPNPTGSDLAPG